MVVCSPSLDGGEERRREGGREITVCLRDVIFDYDWLIATQLFHVFIKRGGKRESNERRKKKTKAEEESKTATSRDNRLRHG